MQSYIQTSQRLGLCVQNHNKRKLACCSSRGATSVLKLQVPFATDFGNTLAIVRSPDWEQPTHLNWTDGDVWTGEVEAEAGTLEYKYVVLSSGAIGEWQPGDNMMVEVPHEAAVVHIDDQWLAGGRSIRVEATASIAKAAPKEPEAHNKMPCENMMAEVPHEAAVAQIDDQRLAGGRSIRVEAPASIAKAAPKESEAIQLPPRSITPHATQLPPSSSVEVSRPLKTINILPIVAAPPPKAVLPVITKDVRPTESDHGFNKMTTVRLKQLLKSHKLKSTGKKEALISRLQRYMAK